MNETPSRLLGAARQCIRERGFAGTTSRHITAAADANLAAITYHFGSKDRLIAEALLDGLRGWLAPTLDVLGGGGDPSARMLVAIQTLATTFNSHREDVPAYLEALVQAPHMEELQDGLGRLTEEVRGVLASHVSDMQKRQELAAWVDPDAMSSLLLAVATGLALQATVDPDGPSLEAMAGQFGALLLAARQN